MPNYGDVALNLSPQWNREALHNSNLDYQLWTVGHEGGVSDAFLKEDPERRHQFAWVDPRRTDEVSKNKVKGYEFVKCDKDNPENGAWIKNSKLWDVTAEGFVALFGQHLMARPAERFFADQAIREKAIANRRDKDGEAAKRLAEQHGIDMTDDDDRPRTRRRSA